MSDEGPRTMKRQRTKAEMVAIRAAILAALAEDAPMTVRQVFYRLVARGVIAKTEMEYKKTVVRLLTEMRLSGQIPFEQIVDNTRWRHKPVTFSSKEEALRDLVESYRRAVWDNQDDYVEVWLEKDALTGVFYEETETWDVSLMPVRGDSSLSFLHEGGQVIAEQGKPVYLYYFGDHDPTGVEIPRVVENRIRLFAPEAEMHFERVAVTPAQITELHLPTRPTKESTRSADFEGESVELDAISPRDLRRLVRECIERHLDQERYREMQAAQAADLRWLRKMIERPSRSGPPRPKRRPGR